MTSAIQRFLLIFFVPETCFLSFCTLVTSAFLRFLGAQESCVLQARPLGRSLTVLSQCRETGPAVDTAVRRSRTQFNAYMVEYASTLEALLKLIFNNGRGYPRVGNRPHPDIFCKTIFGAKALTHAVQPMRRQYALDYEEHVHACNRSIGVC